MKQAPGPCTKMTVTEVLARKKYAVIDRCVRLTMETYPAESITFLQEEKDPFVNPVGSTLRRELRTILEGIIASDKTEQLIPSLDAIVRIRAVQDFLPSEALAFTVHLKKAIREELRNELISPDLVNDLEAFDLRIDALTLAAFDLYTKCREKIAEIRLGEARSERDRLARVVKAMGRGPRSNSKR